MNEVMIPFGGEAADPAFGGVMPANEGLGDSVGTGYPIIGYKGRTWSLRWKGQNHFFTRADDGTPAAVIKCIILRQAPGRSKSYFPKYDPNAEAVNPICTSLDGMHPDLGVMEKQSDTCAGCVRNRLVYNAEGRRGKECQDYLRLAVALLPPDLIRLLGEEINEPAFLRVPPASMKALAAFGDAMKRANYPYFSFVTQIGFVPGKSWPEFTFTAVQRLTKDEAPAIIEMRESATALRITGEDQTGTPQLATVQAPKAIDILPPSERIETGFGRPKLVSPPAAVQHTEEDTGVSAATAEMDAKIAAALAASVKH